MEDFSLALLEDGQELGSSHGFWGKLMCNEGFPLWIKISGLGTTPPLSIPTSDDKEKPKQLNVIGGDRLKSVP